MCAPGYLDQWNFSRICLLKRPEVGWLKRIEVNTVKLILVDLKWKLTQIISKNLKKLKECWYFQPISTSVIPVSYFGIAHGKTLPKAQRTRGLSSAYQSNLFRSYHKFTQILIKFHFQNTDHTSTSKSRPNIGISTKLKIQNIDQT